MIEDVAGKLRMFWASIAVCGIYGFTMLSLMFLSTLVGRPRAYHRTLWMLGHLEEWIAKTGRHRDTEEQVEAEKAEG